ncbi:MAG: hypothetical protein ABEL97_01360 [Salinibacter sp.]
MTVWTHGPPSGGTPRSAARSVAGRIGLLVLLGWSLLGAAVAQPRLDVHVSVDSVRIGERFVVSVVAEHRGGVDVAFPAPDAGPGTFGELEVLGRSARRRRAAGGRQVDSVAYTTTTFALDSVRVPSLPVRVIADGDTSTMQTPARTARVVSVVGPDAEGIHGVAPPAPFPRPLWTWGVLALVAAALLGGAAYLWWRRGREPKSQPSGGRPAVDRTPYEAARSRIRRLEASDLSDPDAVPPFYVELSQALRVYLAREWDVAALERTTREVVNTLDGHPDVPDEAVSRVRAVLELADLVKFADARPAAEDHEKALREARSALEALEAPSASPPEAIDGVASAESPTS